MGKHIRIIWNKNRKWVLFVFGLSIVLFLIYFCVPAPDTVMTVEARTRAIEFEVINPTAASIRFAVPVCVKRTPRDNGEFLTGFVEPMPGAKALYRFYGDYLILRYINGEKVAARFSTGNPRAAIDLTGAATISLVEGCERGSKPAAQPMRLPIWGSASMGEVVTSATDVGKASDQGGILLGGAVQLFGKTTTLSFWGNSRPELYFAAKIELPVGSRLAGEREETGGAAWWGFALYSGWSEPTAANAALDVAASSEAKRLVLSRMGSQHRGEVLEVGYFVQVFNDPLYLRIQLLIVGIFGILQFVHVIKELSSKD